MGSEVDWKREVLSWCVGFQLLVVGLAVAGFLNPDLRPLAIPAPPSPSVEEIIPLTDFSPQAAPSSEMDDIAPSAGIVSTGDLPAPVEPEVLESSLPVPLAMIEEPLNLIEETLLPADAILEAVPMPVISRAEPPRTTTAQTRRPSSSGATPATGGTGASSSSTAASVGAAGSAVLFTQAGSGRFPLPPYPQEARARGWQGRVMVQVEVGQDGRPAVPSVETSSGHSVLDRTACDWIRRRWRWEAGQPRNFRIPIQFRLQ